LHSPRAAAGRLARRRDARPAAGLLALALSIAAALLLALAPPRAARADGPAGDAAGGALHAFVFAADGRPTPEVTIEAGGASARSDAGGYAALRLPAGTYALRVLGPGGPLAVASVTVGAGGVTEVIVRLGAPGAPAEVEVEGPAVAPAPAAPPAEAARAPARAPGLLRGVVLDEKEGRPLAGARVFVRGRPGEARTGPDGRFSIPLPPGAHAVSVVHPERASRSLEGVVVPEGGAADLEVRLAPAAVELPYEQVRGYRIEGGLVSTLEERREERGVVDIIGREQIGKSGDSDAAQALRRVTGLTVVGGRYVYVRGMGERYSSTLLDGTLLPSPEPERRVVPLDLFPVDVIESVSIRKTYSPEVPGDFGGGAVLLRTRQPPDRFVAGASLSLGYNDETSLRSGSAYEGGGTDLLGFDDGTRALPSVVEAAARGQPITLRDPVSGQGYTPAELERLGEAMPRTWSVERERTPPDASFSLTLGDRWDPGVPLGALLSVVYSNQHRTRDREVRQLTLGSRGELTPTYDYRARSTVHTVDAGVILSPRVEPAPGHSLEATSLLVRTTSDRAEVYEGEYTDQDTVIRVSELEWVEQMLLSEQVRGRHDLPLGLELLWRYAFARASRSQPDARRTRYDRDPGSGLFLLSDRPEGNQRLYNELVDRTHDAGATLALPIELSSGTLRPSAGGSILLRDRESETRRFRFLHAGPRSRDPAVLSQAAEGVFSPPNIGPDGFQLAEITRATDSYEASQTLLAAFADVLVPIAPGWELSAGARVERSSQEVTTYNLFDRGRGAVRADLSTTDVLPAAALAWRFLPDMQLRAGYGRTVSRPDFRELSQAPFDQVVGAGVFVGNPDLERATIDHVDLRWEWYPAADETVSAGLFWKRLTDPIETVILGGANPTTTLANAKSGENVGLEVDARKSLGFIDESLRPFYASGNLALILSEVEISNPGVATERERPLQGQSPFVVNVALGYDDPVERIDVALLYNVSGERIRGIGTFGVPDVYEQPFHQLDLAASWGFAERWTLRLRVQNLLDDAVELTQEGEVVERYRPGRTVTLGVGWSF
jgi:outer membrane receptor protein involved in Fe transport